MYSNTMIENLNPDGCEKTDTCFFITPINGSIVLGIVGFVGALLGPLVIGNMKRKNNMLYGHGCMGLTIILMAIFKIYAINVPLFICMCLYAVLY